MSELMPDAVEQIRPRLHLLGGSADHVAWQGSAEEEQWNVPFGPAEEWELVVTDRTIRGPHGDIPIRIYAPPTARADRPCLVWYHGGAFIAGDLDMPEGHEVASGIAGRADAVVVSVDYRLCPPPVNAGGPEPQPGDVRFPVPHDDAHAAVVWVQDHAGELGVDTSRISIGGASAGGNLAASVALRLRDENRPPQQVFLEYPLVHPVLEAETDAQRRDIGATPLVLQFPPLVQEELNANYLGGPDVEPSPYAFAGLAPSLEGYPPTYIENAQYDSLRVSGERFGAQLAEAGVDVEMHLVRGVPHGHLNKPGLEAMHTSMDAIAQRILERA